MASVKTTMMGLLVLVLLAALGAGGTFLYLQWTAYKTSQDMTLVESYLQQNQPQEAVKILSERLATAKAGQTWLPQALAYQFDAYDQLGEKAAAEALAARVLDKEKPLAPEGSEAWRRAHAALGRAALEGQQAEAALEHFQAILTAPPLSDWGQAEATYGLARLEMAAGKSEQARDRLAQLMETLPETDPVRANVEKLLGMVNMKLLMWRQPQEDQGDQIYILKRGDTIDKLKKQFGVSAELVMRINQIDDPRRLTIGRRLKIPNLDLSIVVNKTDNTLTLYNRGKFFKKYDVRTGEFDYMTPVGEFRIENKKKDPAWNNPQDHKTYPAGDPGNQLGARWMGFQGSNLGIHEAVDPGSIGTYSSNGCIGLRQEDVIELYDLVPVGTPVTIKGEIISPAP